MNITFNLEAREVFNDVKMNTSYIAERTDRFDDIVFDEEYTALFHNFFMEARSVMASRISSNILEFESDGNAGFFVDRQDYAEERDFIITLSLPDDWKKYLRRYVYTEMRAFATAYVIYRWLVDKIPPVQAVTVRHWMEEYESHLDNIVRSLEKRMTKPRIRPCMPW